MSTEALQPYADVVVANADHIALKLALKLKDLPLDKQRETFAGSRDAGYFYLFRHEEFPDMVYECVASPVGGDALTSVYMNHRIFGSGGTLIAAREHLIRSIADKVGLPAESVGVDDEGRGRTLGLSELSTGQLIDMLAERMGKTIIVPNSHSAAGLGGVKL